MEKDFDNWNNLKKKIDQKDQIPLFNEREVWLCSFGVNIGDEENGKGENSFRPVLVFKKFNKNIFYGIPITSKLKDNKFHFIVNVGEINGSVILSQMKLIDVRRLSYLMVRIPSDDYDQIKEKLKSLIF